MRGMPVLGYDVVSKGGRLVVNREEAPMRVSDIRSIPGMWFYRSAFG